MSTANESTKSRIQPLSKTVFTPPLSSIRVLFYSIGSAIGAICTTWVFAHAGWSGVCILGAMTSAVAILFLHLAYRKHSTGVIN
ncbi:hypothetical protein ACNSO8_08755 [Yersinia sp. LJYL362]|uniref:hypothetical protein n=1 Tax=Yersinia sp. LJYL362 TaxID=3402108 RepID=UPI003AB2896B